MTELYYSHPVQIRFWEPCVKRYVGAIAYKDFVICGCCGSLIPIQDIIDTAKEFSNMNEDEAIVELDWIDINQEIVGGQ